jgi:hypothetical protein
VKVINHVGYVVRSIENFRQTLPPLDLIKAVDDPVQHARIELLGLSSGSAIELIEPQDKQSFTWNFLEKYGEGMHHVCYEGYSMAELEKIFRERRMIRLRGPIPAVLFERDVIFAMTKSKAIVEFII